MNLKDFFCCAKNVEKEGKMWYNFVVKVVFRLIFWVIFMVFHISLVFEVSH